MNTALQSIPAAVPAPTAVAVPTAPVDPLVQALQAQAAALTGGIAADDYLRAWSDWWLTLAARPEQSLPLATQAMARATDTWTYAAQAALGAAPPHGHEGKGHANPLWDQWPFNAYAHGHAQLQQWCAEMLAATPELADANAKRLEFALRQLQGATDPAHYLPTNPELLGQTMDEGGANLLRGWQHWLEDAQRRQSGGAAPGAEHHKVGEQVAITPGVVVMRNELCELIQYSPQVAGVHAEPILITPAWIMKYYILDLSPHNSLVNYLVGKGHTVFMISWKNPTPADRDLGMEDYVQLGLRAALDAAGWIVPGRRVHAVGYCIGGTLLAIGAATLAAEGDTRMGSVTLFAAQTDFSEPGELSLFITPSQIAMLEALMQREGVLGSERMGGAFAMLRPADLIWAPVVNQYLRGQRAALNDLMAWNADGTRMPARMHGEYLRRLYLHNELATGRYTLAGRPVDLKAITVPMFVVGTETDHVAPWQSVYKTRALTSSPDYTFVLTSGGHNAGIISGAENPKRRHRTLHWQAGASTPAPAQYLEAAQLHAGSWWPTWQQWLVEHSAPGWYDPPPLGNTGAGLPPLGAAPGEYVHG